jgi:hypothetical protein
LASLAAARARGFITRNQSGGTSIIRNIVP